MFQWESKLYKKRSTHPGLLIDGYQTRFFLFGQLSYPAMDWLDGSYLMRSKCQNFLLLCDGKKYKIIQWESAGIDRAEVERLHQCMEPLVNKATSSTRSGMQQPQLLQEVLQKVSAVNQRGQWGKACCSKRNEFYYLSEKKWDLGDGEMDEHCHSEWMQLPWKPTGTRGKQKILTLSKL